MDELARCFDETVDGLLLSFKATGDGRCNLFCVRLINIDIATHNSSYTSLSQNIEAVLQVADDVREELLCDFL